MVESSSAVTDFSGLTYTTESGLTINNTISATNIVDAYLTTGSFTGNTAWTYGHDFNGSTATFLDGQEYQDGTFVYKMMNGTFVKWTRALPETIGFEIRNIATGQTYTLDVSAPYNYYISGLTYKSNVGTIVFDIQYQLTGVTGLSNLTGTTTKTSNWATAGNNVAQGNEVTIYVKTITSSATTLIGSLINIISSA